MQAEIDLLRENYRRFSEGDAVGAAQLLEANVEYVLPATFPRGMGGVFHGRQEVLRMWESMLNELEYWRIEPEKVVPIPPDRLLVLACTRAKAGEALRAVGIVDWEHVHP